MQISILTFYQYRKQLRRELFLKRQLDRDNSEKRLYEDAIKLDALLVSSGYKLLYPTEWGKYRAKNYQEVGITDLFGVRGQ